MEPQNRPSNGHDYVGRSLEVTIKVGIALGLIVWCFMILKPFLMITLWGVIISIAVFPMFHKLKVVMGNRRKMAAVLVTLFLLSLILFPII